MKTKKENQFPSTYDYFYHDCWILKKIYCKELLDSITNQNIRGVSYFFELLIIDTIDHLTSLSSNSNTSDIVQWSESSFSEKAIRELSKKDTVIGFCVDLNKQRKSFVPFRVKEGRPNVKRFKVELAELFDKIKEINDFVFKELKITKLFSGNQDLYPALNWFICKFNYIQRNYPGDILFHNLMTDNTRRNYHLQNPVIRKYADEYIRGYCLILEIFYKNVLTPKIYAGVKSELRKLKSWDDIHKFYRSLPISEKGNIFKPLFKINDKLKTDSLLDSNQITTEYQLDIIFRRINRLRFKLNRSYYGDFGYDNINHFLYVLLGARYIQKGKIEVVEFREILNKGDYEYSYMIFMPLSGMISDGSYWMFFDKLAVSRGKGYKSGGKFMIDGYIKELKKTDRYNFLKYDIKRDLLKEYINKRDHLEVKFSNLSEKVKDSKGLIAEFLAYLHVAKLKNAVLKEIRKDVKNTDIDVVAENDDTVFIIQSKTTFPIKKSSVKDVIDHFNKIKTTIKTKKNISKILHLIFENTDPNEKDEDFFEKNTSIFTVNEILSQKNEILAELKKDNIEVLYYKDLRKKLKGKTYEKLISTIDNLFEYNPSYLKFINI